jgi:hypothetical protein
MKTTQLICPAGRRALMIPVELHCEGEAALSTIQKGIYISLVISQAGYRSHMIHTCLAISLVSPKPCIRVASSVRLVQAIGLCRFSGVATSGTNSGSCGIFTAGSRKALSREIPDPA